jgi:ADP-heptose:LPS heptosyltransferase
MKKAKVVNLSEVRPNAGFLLRVSGGFGKNIMATRVAKELHEAYPNLPIHVLASYPDAFANLPFVEKFYHMGQPLPDFYDSHHSFEILDIEPYIAHDYRIGKKHLVNVWCERLGLKAPESPAGVVMFNKQEEKSADMIVTQLKQQTGSKPLIGLQWVGGTSFYNAAEAQNPNRVSMVRELTQENAQKVVDKLIAEQKIPVVIGLPTEPRLQNAVHLLDANGQAFPIRLVLAVISKLDGLIAVDSFAQHAWAAMGKRDAVVLWGATSPEQLGYETNTNIKPAANCCRYGGGCGRPDMHVGDWQGNSTPWQCPYDAKCMDYNAADVVKKVK